MARRDGRDVMGVGTTKRLLGRWSGKGKFRLSIIARLPAGPGKGVGKLFDATLVSTLEDEPQRGSSERTKRDGQQKWGQLGLRARSLSAFGAGGMGLEALTTTGVGNHCREGKCDKDPMVAAEPLLRRRFARFAMDPVHSWLDYRWPNLHLRTDGAKLQSGSGEDGGRYRPGTDRAYRFRSAHCARHVVTPLPPVAYLIETGDP